MFDLVVERLLLWSSQHSLNQCAAEENRCLRTRGQGRNPALKSAGSHSHQWAPRDPVEAAFGTVALFPVTVAPPGYLKLNGALLSRTTYATL
jgi:hypothetical protein